MDKKVHETIIIGGGISGLSCARKLADEGKNFLLITKELGGRIKYSDKTPEINFGGVYLTKDYKNVFPYTKIIEKFKIKDFYFYDDRSYVSVFSLKELKRFPKILKFLFILMRFRRHLLKYRKKAPYKSLKECINEDKLLKKYWQMKVPEFLKSHNFEDLDLIFGNPAVETNDFIDSKKLNVFYYMLVFLTMVRKAYIVDLSTLKEEITKGFESQIIIETVIKIKKQDGLFFVETNLNSYLTKNLVIAGTYQQMSKIYNVPKPYLQTSTYTIHLKGERLDKYKNKKGIVFRPNMADVFLLWKQKNGDEIIYTNKQNTDLNKYFKSYEIIQQVYWKEAMNIPGKDIIEQKLEENVYLASDYNFSLMEDAFLTGLYAANQIIKNSN